MDTVAGFGRQADNRDMGAGMSSIESIGQPLAFQSAGGLQDFSELPSNEGVARVRTMTRALAGMQKEAIVHYGPTNAVWRVVCDEGPWLNGTDLAPFPLAFFTSGIAASAMSAFLREAVEHGLHIDSLGIAQDNYFSMEGSALRGTMKASALPMRLDISARGNATSGEFEQIMKTAIQDRCPVIQCLRETISSGFAARVNGAELALPGQAAVAVSELDDPAGLFDRIYPESTGSTGIITKSQNVSDEGTEAVGLKTDQKRIVHVHTGGASQADGLKSIAVQCIKPSGSRFQLLSDESSAAGSREQAPAGLVYFAAGAAFCFMTQIGRYAQITRNKLDGYRIVQDFAFPIPGGGKPGAPAVETLVCLETEAPPGNCIEMVRMGQQTCYVHAAFGASTQVELNFQPDSSNSGSIRQQD